MTTAIDAGAQLLADILSAQNAGQSNDELTFLCRRAFFGRDEELESNMADLLSSLLADEEVTSNGELAVLKELQTFRGDAPTP